MGSVAVGGFEEEFLTLVDAEAMLLVDNTKSERIKLGIVGEEGVGTDDEVDLAIGDAFFKARFLLGSASK